MTDRLQTLLEIAKLVLPPIGALIDDEDGEQLAKDVADIVEAVVGHLAPADQMKSVEDDPALQAELKIKLEEAANRQAAADNRALEAKYNDELETGRRELANDQHDHEEELEDFQKTLESTEAARAYAAKAAASERWWVSFVNPVLSLIIVTAFFVFILLIARNPIGVEVFLSAAGNVIPTQDVRVVAEGTYEDVNGNRLDRRIIGNNLEVFYVAFGAMATAFVTVVGFHFGSSSGSQRKTKLQRLYGTRGTLQLVKLRQQFQAQLLQQAELPVSALDLLRCRVPMWPTSIHSNGFGWRTCPISNTSTGVSFWRKALATQALV